VGGLFLPARGSPSTALSGALNESGWSRRLAGTSSDRS
jgi:hypothetical protein